MKHIWIVVVGFVMLAIGQLVSEVMPLVGRAAFQLAAAGQYSPSNYAMDLAQYNFLAVAVILIGIIAFVLEQRNFELRQQEKPEVAPEAQSASSSDAYSAGSVQREP